MFIELTNLSSVKISSRLHNLINRSLTQLTNLVWRFFVRIKFPRFLVQSPD